MGWVVVAVLGTGAVAIGTTTAALVVAGGPGHTKGYGSLRSTFSTAPPPATGIERKPGTLDAISCPTATTCLTAGSGADGDALVATSTDAGLTWSAAATPKTAPPLSGVACATLTTCTAVGGRVALYSADGGATWTAKTIGPVDASLTAVACASSSTCVATAMANRPGVGGSAGLVFLTSDAGQSWQQANVPSWAPGLFSVACVSQTTCVAVGGTILVTKDAGRSWQNRTVAGGMNGLSSIACPSADLCLAVGPNAAGISDPQAPGDYVVSHDGGNTWAQATFPEASASVWEIACGSPTSCLASGDAPRAGTGPPLLTSSDGGATWAQGVPPGITDVAGIACPGSTCIGVGHLASGSASITITQDGGRTWTSGALP